MELKKALNQEKMDKAERKRVEREAALKVIAENEEDREKRAVQKVQDRILAQKMLADEEAAAIKEEKKRLKEWEDRDRKIKEKLERMGDVMKKSNAAEKELERRIVRDQLVKDKLAEKEEIRRKNVTKEHLLSVNATLEKQISDKEHRKMLMKQDNQKYIQ